MRLITARRFNYIDSVTIALTVHWMDKGIFVVAAVILIGSLFSTTMERKYGI